MKILNTLEYVEKVVPGWQSYCVNYVWEGNERTHNRLVNQYKNQKEGAKEE